MNRFKRAASLAGAVIFGLSLFVTSHGFQAEKAQAGAISNLTLSVADKTLSATTSYTISFKTATAIPSAGGYIHLLIDGVGGSGASPASAPSFSSYTVGSTSSPNTISHVGYDSYAFASGVILGTSTAINAGTTVTIVLNNVVNPGRAGYYSVHLWTTQYATALDGASSWGGDAYSPYTEIGTTTNVVGKVTDADGNPVIAASVTLNGGNWINYTTAYTDKNGNYGMNAPAGNYTFNLSLPFAYDRPNTYIPPPDVQVTVPASGVLTKNVAFVAQTKTITGKVTRDTADGPPIADVTISINPTSGSGWVNATTDSNGNYTAKVTGGNWMISYYSKTYPSTWVAATMSDTFSFANDNTVETKTKNFIGNSVDSTIKGKVRKADGSIPSGSSIGFTFMGTGTNGTYSTNVDNSGNFTVLVTKGTYSINGWVSDNTSSMPTLDNVTVAKGETKDLGTITLISKTDSIVGKVSDSQGNPIVGATVNASITGGGSDWAYATTDSNGRYTLKVRPGIWQVSTWNAPGSNANVVNNSKPVSVTVKAGIVSTQDFTYQSATNTITGTIIDPDGKPITNLNPWVSASDGTQDWSNIGVSAQNGAFTLKVPKGKWTITSYIYSSDFSSPDAVVVNFDGDNQSTTVTLKAVRNDATITGTVYDSDGNKITGKYISIWATKGRQGSWQQAAFNQSDATYTIKVSSGRWGIGWWVDPTLGYSAGAGLGAELDLASGETKNYDIKLKKSDATITGKVTKDDGTAFPGVWVNADTRDPNTKTDTDAGYYSNGVTASGDGSYTLKVPAGTYFVGGNMWYGSGYLNPKRVKVTVATGQTGTADLVFRKADATITGKVTKDGSTISAFVTAYSEEGGYAEGKSGNDGMYNINASTTSKWHVRAMLAEGKTFFRSKEAIVQIDPAKEPKTISADLDLTKQNFSLPTTQTVTFDPTVQQTVSLDDGTTITIPANVVATSGNITITAEPDTSLATESDSKPLAYGYNFKLVDQTGKEITKFTGNVTIQFKYQDSWLTDNHITDQEVNTAYYDTAASTWQDLKQCAVNTTEKTITCQVDHFTKFALVAASDLTPPAAPTSVVVTADSGKNHLTWVNPTDSDFASVTIYRSTTLGTLGDKLVGGIPTTSYDDTKDLVKETTYFYTVKAVDKSGNESVNTDQVSAASQTTTSSILPKTGLPGHSRFGLWLTLALILAGGRWIMVRKKHGHRPVRLHTHS